MTSTEIFTSKIYTRYVHVWEFIAPTRDENVAGYWLLFHSKIPGKNGGQLVSFDKLPNWRVK